MQAPQKILPLTSLRFFAALYVVFFHTTPLILRAYLPAFFAGYISLGFSSVSFFFTLSGYILAVVYLAKGGRLNRKRFWLARFARIYPLFVFTLILETPNLLIYRISNYGMANAVAKTSVTFVANLAMLQAWFLQLKGIDDPNWSLAVETVFYLIFPFIAYPLWRLSRRGALVLLCVTYLAAIAAPYVGTQLHIYMDVLKYNPLFHIAEFVAGILLARWHASVLGHEGSRRSLQKLSPILALAAIGLFCAVVHYQALIPLAIIHDGLLIPISSLAIVAFASNNKLIERAFSGAVFVALGEASYGLYLIHIPIAHYVTKAHLESSVRFFPVYILLVIGMSVAIFYAFERPMRRAILKWTSTPPRESLPESSLAQ